MWRSVALLICAGAAVAFMLPEKRAEKSPAPFATWPRYGRSPSLLMATRNDRFFSPRYGKRSELESDSHPHRNFGHDTRDLRDYGQPRDFEARDRNSRANLLCDYTGVSTLYRCNGHAHTTDARKEDSRSSSEGK